MSERKFQVVDDMNHILATGMELEVALLFIKAYYREYYNSSFDLTIRVVKETEDE